MLDVEGDVRPAAAIDLSDGTCRFCAARSCEAILARSETAIAFASWGAFIEGWTLVVPTEHTLALAELSNSAWFEFEGLAAEVRQKISAKFGDTVMFEHGAAGSGRHAGCGVDHAHLHIVPWTGDLRNAIHEAPEVSTFDWQESGPRPVGVPDHDYIWMSDGSGSWITHAPMLPSQVVRRALAHAAGLTVWDWKQDLHLDVVRATNFALQAH